GLQALKKLAHPQLLRGATLVSPAASLRDVDHAVVDPATDEVVADVPSCGSRGTHDAVDAAQHAFGSWRDVLARDRGVILSRWAALMRAHREDLATIIVVEQGKAFEAALAEIEYGARFL